MAGDSVMEPGKRCPGVHPLVSTHLRISLRPRDLSIVANSPGLTEKMRSRMREARERGKETL